MKEEGKKGKRLTREEKNLPYQFLKDQAISP